MYKIAVLGSYDSIYGFAALGLDTFPVEDAKEGAEKLKKLAENNFAVIYITEELAKDLSHEIDKLKERVLPAVILIPGISGNTGDGVQQVKDCVEKAVGSDIIFGEN
ncbi:V-type ATP synthase subunit F [Eubacterium oxidoreducens]|uniref:V/A-type H+-transporting ATPase subunit F n=1 Tax=Eubacterium oxidoreducens TaxID=1732 RepID=A0A1G6C7F7_EUBOX|nr:V-type ATP synthase subunit F [Eubacterium oxidoreducens]SDB28836.1 V/A-type H+-transporting ATPase subunit F [Eubacterium oxidoreducens]